MENYYIVAAIELGLIEKTSGIGFNGTTIVLKDGSVVPISDSIKKRAAYLKTLADIRNTRNELIQSTDWISGIDIPDSKLKGDLISYRQQLRDITSQISEDNLLVVWPTDPRIVIEDNSTMT